MPAPATSRREFSQRDLIALYTEIYDNIKSPQARRLDIAVRLLSESGTEVFAVRDELENGGVAPKKAVGHLRLLERDRAEGRRAGPLRCSASKRRCAETSNDAKPAARETLITQ